jgi:hypothetical protein
VLATLLRAADKWFSLSGFMWLTNSEA